MKIKKSGATYSAIVGIGEQIRKQSQQTGEEFILLNRGINAVCTIDLNTIVSDVDFNTNAMQVYPPSQGRMELRTAINQHYFGGKADTQNILICGGGMSALDLVFQTLDVKRIVLPEYYWGSYAQIMKIRGIEASTYENLKMVENNLPAYRDSAILLCDPNNPLGSKQKDEEILKQIELCNNNEIVVLVDCPYRRIFCGEEDEFYQKLLAFERVIVVESFSKSLGLSGQRLGFVHSPSTEFSKELGIRLMYATNGINAFSQLLVHQLLTSEKGKKAVADFKNKTTEAIRNNIRFLIANQLLAEEFYQHADPVGIFVIVNKSEKQLLDKRIGSVSLHYFTENKKEEAQQYARICVSVPHDKFKNYFSQF